MQRRTPCRNKKERTAESGSPSGLYCQNASPLFLFFSSRELGSTPFRVEAQSSVRPDILASGSSPSGQRVCVTWSPLICQVLAPVRRANAAAVRYSACFGVAVSHLKNLHFNPM